MMDERRQQQHKHERRLHVENLVNITTDNGISYDNSKNMDHDVARYPMQHSNFASSGAVVERENVVKNNGHLIHHVTENSNSTDEEYFYGPYNDGDSDLSANEPSEDDYENHFHDNDSEGDDGKSDSLGDPHDNLLQKLRRSRERRMDQPSITRTTSTTTTSIYNDEALSYLLRYETMVRQQEAEDMAVIAHIQPCLERLEQLIAQSKEQDTIECNGLYDEVKTENDNSTPPISAETKSLLDREISFIDLKIGFDILEKMSAKEDSAHDKDENRKEFMTTDRQFMMVLRLLTTTTSSPMPRNRGSCDIELDMSSFVATNRHDKITWAEIIHCYKVCISGMIALQHMSPVDPCQVNGACPASRTRTRDRTLAMLTLFQPPSLSSVGYRLHRDARMSWNDGTIKSTNGSSNTKDSRKINKEVGTIPSQYISPMNQIVRFAIVLAAVIALILYHTIPIQNNVISDFHFRMMNRNSDGNTIISTSRSIIEDLFSINGSESESLDELISLDMLDDGNDIGDDVNIRPTNDERISNATTKSNKLEDDTGVESSSTSAHHSSSVGIVTTIDDMVDSWEQNSMKDAKTFQFLATYTDQYHPTAELLVAPTMLISILAVAVAPVIPPVYFVAAAVAIRPVVLGWMHLRRVIQGNRSNIVFE